MPRALRRNGSATFRRSSQRLRGVLTSGEKFPARDAGRARPVAGGLLPTRVIRRAAPTVLAALAGAWAAWPTTPVTSPVTTFPPAAPARATGPLQPHPAPGHRAPDGCRRGGAQIDVEWGWLRVPAREVAPGRWEAVLPR